MFKLSDVIWGVGAGARIRGLTKTMFSERLAQLGFFSWVVLDGCSIAKKRHICAMLVRRRTGGSGLLWCAMKMKNLVTTRRLLSEWRCCRHRCSDVWRKAICAGAFRFCTASATFCGSHFSEVYFCRAAEPFPAVSLRGSRAASIALHLFLCTFLASSSYAWAEFRALRYACRCATM